MAVPAVRQQGLNATGDHILFPGIIWYGMIETVLAIVSGRDPVEPATTMRGSVSSSVLASSAPVMPSFAPSQEMVRRGERFERSALG